MVSIYTGSAAREDFPRRPKPNPSSVVQGDHYRFTVLTDGLIRYEYAHDGVFEDRASTFAINRDLPAPKFDVVDHEGHLEIITDKFHLNYDKKPFTGTGLSVQAKGKITDWKSCWRYGGGIQEEPYYLYGTARTLDEADGRIPLERGVIAKNGYSNMDDSHSFLFNEKGWVEGRREGERVDGYLFAYGLDYKGAIKALYALSGNQPLLPRWALGNWWSRYYKYTADEYLDLMDRFRKAGIPLCVGVIDMDWHLVEGKVVEESGFSGWTGYTWEKKLFPDPAAFVDGLHTRGLRTCLNDHPADGCAPYEEKFKEMSIALGKDPAKKHPIAFDIANKKFADAYYDILLKNIEDDGVDFWWVDWQQGTHSSIAGVDPLWLLNHLSFLNNKHGNNRPLTFSRFAGPGSHRYPVGFSGDSVVTWASLAFQPEFTATASNIGYGWWSHDIGGHMNGYRDDELATRWVQLGVFSPILRLHSSNNPWNSKEPWRFNSEACVIQTAALRLRHQLMPYLYSMNVRSAKDSEPLVQPVYWHYPREDKAYWYKDTYYFGSELFVAPITSPRDKVTTRGATPCWLPPGRFVDIFGGMVYDGDRDITFHRTLSSYAVLAKEGSIIPFDASEQPENGCPNPQKITVKVVVGADAYFTLYEDDDSGSSVDQVNLVTTPITWSQADGTLTIGPASGASAAIPSHRDWEVEFLTLSGKDARISHKAIPTSSKLTFSLSTKNPQLAVNKPLELAYAVVDDAQSSFDDKNAIWAVLSADRPFSVRMGNLMALESVEASLKSALAEVLLADSRAYE